MKKFFLSVLILGDLAVIGGAGFLIYKRATTTETVYKLDFIERLKGMPKLSKAPAIPSASTSTPLQTSSSTVAVPVPTGTPKQSNILFAYFNKKAKGVSMTGDFTNWKPQPMAVDAKGRWTFAVKLSPGEYGYEYIVDGKAIRDPANKKTKKKGKETVSLQVVKGAAVPAATASPAPAKQ